MASRLWRRVDDPWDTLPSPGPLHERANALQIGEHLRRLAAEAGILTTPAEALAIARRRGLDPTEQEVALRHLSGPTGPPFVLPEAPSSLPGMNRGATSPKCPKPRMCWGVSRTTGRDFVWAHPCGGWGCPVCGEAKAWTTLAEANFRFEAVDGLWVATAGTDATTTDRIRQRRHANRPVADLTVRRRDDTKYIYASVDLSGDEPPRNGECMTRDDALRHLQEVALSPPQAVDQVRWLPNAWPALPEEVPQDTIGLGEPDPDLRELVLDELRERATAELGVDTNDDDWQERLPELWMATEMKAAVDRHRQAGWRSPGSG